MRGGSRPGFPEARQVAVSGVRHPAVVSSPGARQAVVASKAQAAPGPLGPLGCCWGTVAPAQHQPPPEQYCRFCPCHLAARQKLQRYWRVPRRAVRTPRGSGTPSTPATHPWRGPAATRPKRSRGAGGGPACRGLRAAPRGWPATGKQRGSTSHGATGVKRHA